MPKKLSSYLILPLIVLLGLILAGSFWLYGKFNIEDPILIVTLIIGTVPLIYRMLKDLMKGHFGVDVIAITTIIAAFFMQQYLAGTVIVLMLSGGEALEAYALQRARKELSSLISNAPSIAHIKLENGLKDVSAYDVLVGDIILVKPGEVVPVDGLVIAGVSEVDESAITGESLPKAKRPGSLTFSGSINKENPLELRTIRPAKESKYEQIISLVKEAEESRAPVVRLADRYSIWFTAITFIIAGLAWFLSGDDIRLLAVLVVATPCPLILATPIAIISGISKSASRGIIIKNGGALETLAQVNAFIFDKTGTLTLGTPEVSGTHAFGISEAELMNISASLDQLSVHILARSLLSHVRQNKNFVLSYPENFKENFGEGVSGDINGKKYLFGKLKFLKNNGVIVPPEAEKEHSSLLDQGKIAVYLGSGDGKLLGSVWFADTIRPEMKQLFQDFQNQKLDKIVMLTGDRKNVAENIAKQLGLSDIHAECLPEDKVKEVKEHQKEFGKVAMVGDGVNDAPALAAADVGIALGGHGSTATADTSDIVITVDNLERVGEAYKIAKHVLHIAKQGIYIGIGLSIFLMVVAALGFIPPVQGALLQELLDVAVIFNALRVNFEKA